jgi:2-dehydropantoate 2-reductase
MLARSGSAVTFLGRPGAPGPHLQAIASRGLRIRGTDFDGIVGARVASDPAEIVGADLILFCVKTVDTDEAAARIAPHVTSGAILVDLQNGVDNPDRMRRLGLDPIAAVVYVAAAVEEPGVVRHRGRGDLVVGHAARKGDLDRAAGWFASGGIPCRVSDAIEGEMWFKLILNSMANATSALTGATYRRLAEFGPTWSVAVDVAREGVEVARRAGCPLELEQVVDRGARVCRDVGGATSSTEQDLAAGRRTEIDSLNGYIARRGEEVGLPTPVNRALWALVKLREAESGAHPGSTPGGGLLGSSSARDSSSAVSPPKPDQ